MSTVLPLNSSAAGTALGRAWRQQATLWLMGASGFAGLGYQMVWTQQCALWLGHESAAVLAVVAAFFGGLALGALLMGPRIEQSPHPVRWYVACELIIALWAMVLLAGMSPYSAWLLDLTGAQPSPWRQWALSFGGTFVLLLPATAAMGATLPAMERITAQWHRQQRSIAGHYASNTLGAVLGVLATTFWLIPGYGLSRTAAVCVVLNVLCALVAMVTLPRRVDTSWPVHMSATKAGTRALLPLAITGLLGIGYEVLVVRVLSQVAEDTVYTFAMLLAVYLMGTAWGAAVYQRWLRQARDAAALGDRLVCALASACLLGTGALWSAERVRAWFVDAAGGSMASGVGAEAVLALMAFGLPTMVMGALFSHLSAQASKAGVGFGRSLGINTLAAALAPPLFGVLLAPAMGPKLVLLMISSAYLLLATSNAWSKPLFWGPALLAVALALWAPQLAFVTVPEGGHLLSYRDGAMAAVSVVEDDEGVARLRINNRQQEGSTSSRLVDARQALLPIFLHPAPHRALFLGLGTGVTSGSAAEDPGLQVDVVELLPEVIDASVHFRRVFDDQRPNPRMHVMAADARRYVRASHQAYDVIVSDNFQPARSGSGALYTSEHFSAVRSRLAAGGLFCQWLPLHQLDLETLRSIVQSFIAVYPDGLAILASNSLETPVIGLVGRADGARLAPVRVRQQLAASRMPTPLAAFGLEDEAAVMGSILAGPSALAKFAGHAPANTDDLPVVAFRAPRITYAADSLPRDRLIALLHELSVKPDEVIDVRAGKAFMQRMAAYWSARNQFIKAGRNVQPANDVQQMLAQVRGPLLQVLRTSPEFRPAYDPLLQMAHVLGQTDPQAARELLADLMAVQPERPEAAQMRQQLAGAQP